MFNLASQFGVSGKQMGKFSTDLANVMAALKKVVNTPYVIYIGADLSQLRDQLRKLRAMYKNATGGPTSLAQGAAAIKELDSMIKALGTINSWNPKKYYGTGSGTSGGGGGGGGSSRPGKDYGELDLPEELSGLPNRDSLIKQAIRNARELQKTIPGASKEAKNDVVSILDGMKKIETVRGVREDLLRRALEDLANIEKKRLEMESKADTIRRIRVGGGDFTAIANVPVNSKTGVSMGGPDGPINITLNLNGTVLTPAQLEGFANMVAAALKRQLAK
jgi:hypothetical protein